MARKKTSTVRVNVKAQISSRLREVRQELFGEHGGPELARRLSLPARTWYNYETGVTVPAEVLLSFIDQTGTNPVWLLTGQGPKYRHGVQDQVLDGFTSAQLIRLGLERLEQQPPQAVLVAPEALPAERLSDFAVVDLVPLASLAGGQPSPAQGHVLAYRDWVPNPRETLAVTVPDAAMHPVLPAGSIVAIDRSVRDPIRLQGRLVAAVIDGRPMIRWLELSGRHLILRPNQPGPEFPLIPFEANGAPSPLIGSVVWSWNRHGEA